MTEIKPSWKIAQQISRRHTLISLKIFLPLWILVIITAILSLKILGYPQSGVILKQFYDAHRTIIVCLVAFIYFIPINFYAIIQIFKVDFKDFKLHILQKKNTEV